MKKGLLFCSFLVGLVSMLSAQIYNPVKWSTEYKVVGNNTVDLTIKATIEKGWRVYATELPSDDGPIATSIYFNKNKRVKTVGELVESKYKSKDDPNFDMLVNYHEKQALFTQQVKIAGTESLVIDGELEFMVCNDERCLPPEFVEFSFDVKDFSSLKSDNSKAEKVDKVEEVEEPVVEEEIEEAETKEKEAAEHKSDNQIFNPISWETSIKWVDETTFDVNFIASLEPHWHLYSQNLPEDDGPIPTTFLFNKTADVEFEGKTIEPKPIVEYDPNFMMDLTFFEESVTFTQRVKGEEGKFITGSYEYMVCDAERCLPPEFVEFKYELKDGVAKNLHVNGKLDVEEIIPSLPNVDLDNPIGDCGEKIEISNVWMVFLFGFLGGLVALLTPCVFPMIPLTVSFFTKGDGDSKGIGKAMLYGFFIFLIYAVLSIPFHFNTDPAVLSEIATSVWLNILFFVVFVVFAISFFGFFEISLPSSLANKADSASQAGGIIGIFFMALTLALVSFSCTGPILGTVLGNALKNGPWPITAAMCGFGAALGLPFALFATFPSMMNKLPSSGGWLNSVKVVLGFVELALALKFLSNADLVEQWGFLKRETFFIIWTVIGAGLGLYLLGLIKFPHDSPIKKLSVFRIGFAALVLAFTVYIAPGVLKDSPWKHDLLSGFPPPTFYSWFEKEGSHAQFDELEPALAEAKAQNKPLLIDFTGWACVNCRKMEETVWTVDSVKNRLEEDFVLVSLYVDDKVKLPKDQQGVVEFESKDGELLKKNIRTIGNKWGAFQTKVFNNNSQPYYVMLTPDGELLGNPVGYTPDEDEYLEYLDCGLEAFEKLK